jgi:hypothetical protein
MMHGAFVLGITGSISKVTPASPGSHEDTPSPRRRLWKLAPVLVSNACPIKPTCRDGWA